MEKEEYAKRNNQLADNLFFRAFLLKEDEFIKKYREEKKADYAKMEETEIATSLKRWDGEIKAITDPVKQKEYVQTVVNNAKEKANELFESKLNSVLDNRKDAYLREYVKNEIDRTYGKQLEKMKDYPARFKITVRI